MREACGNGSMSSSDLCHVGCARMAGQKSLIKFSFFGSRGSSHGHFRLGSPPPVCPFVSPSLFLSLRLISNICNIFPPGFRAEESYDGEISRYIMATSL